MRKIFKAFLPTCLILCITFTIIGCDKDFSLIESDVIGSDNSNFTTPDRIISVNAYNKKLDSVEIVNLASTLLGVYDDPNYGKTTASFVTQIIPTSYEPTFGKNPIIDSVVLTIPYYSKVTGNKTRKDQSPGFLYALDSLYGNPQNSIKLSIFRNGYFLRNFKPGAGFDVPQRYYSNAFNADKTINTALTENTTIDFDAQKESIAYFNGDFKPSNKEIELVKASGETKTYEYLKPSLRIKLDNQFWKEAIIDKEGNAVLNSQSNFKEYFRGLYFKAEPIDSKGSMVMLNLADSGANIAIYYSKDTSESDPARIQVMYKLNFSGNKLNTFINDFDKVTLTNGNKIDGDQKLYLKNVGSMAVVDLFPGPLNDAGVPLKLAALRDEFKNGVNQNTLINEAQLIVYENLTSPSDAHKYDRLYAYDIKNKTPLDDYTFDLSTNANNPLISKFVHLGLRTEEGKDTGVWKYKIRITEHLKNLIFKDSTNTKIGLVLSNNVNYINNALILKNETETVGDGVTYIPAASVLSPRGTILYGSNGNVDANKRMALKLFFTKSK